VVSRVVLISLDGFAAFYWSDPRVRMPTLRRLAERGVVARRMECVFPSTTWPTHASMVTGVRPDRHGVVANYILNRESGRAEDLTGDPIYDADRLLRAPTVYDVAHAAGRRTAAVDWPCTRRAAGLDFNLPFFKDQRVFESATDPDVWRELKALGLPVDRLGEWSQLPKRFLRDDVVADAAAHVLHRHAPDLLLVHFLCADSFQHLHGPRSPEAYWALEYVDHCVSRVLAALPSGALERDTAVLVVSDHGFLSSEREIRVNVRLRQLGLLKIDAEGRIVESRARFVTNHGAGYVYVLDPADRPSLVRDLQSELAGLEGVTGVWGVADYAGLGLPVPDVNPMVGELVLEAAEGYAFGDEARGDHHVGPPRYRGNHGHRPTHPDNGAFFLAAGAGVRRGAELGAIMSRDVAPTVAHLLSVKLGDVEGTLRADALA
jgi:predicted AlkP superfamily pyrophosphatase or phosphodiesterase